MPFRPRQFSVNVAKSAYSRERMCNVLNSFRCDLELLGRDQVYMGRPLEIRSFSRLTKYGNSAESLRAVIRSSICRPWKSCRLCRTIMHRAITNRSAPVQLGQQKFGESSGGVRPGVAGQHICLRHSVVVAQRSSFRDEDVGRTAHGLCQIGRLPPGLLFRFVSLRSVNHCGARHVRSWRENTLAATVTRLTQSGRQLKPTRHWCHRPPSG